MKVCMLTASVSRLGGGVFSALQGLATALHHPPDLAVSVVGLRDRSTDEDQRAWDPLSLQVCDIHGPRSWGFAGALAPALRSVGADLTHVHGLWMYPSLVNLMQARGGMPYVISPHGMLDPWAVANANWKKRLVLWLYEAAHLNGAGCIHVLCEAERRAIRAFGLKNPVCIIPNGVDLADAPSGCSKVPDWSEEVPPGCKMLLFLGRIHPKKNLIALLRAWALAQRRRVAGFSDWHLVIAGWDQGNHRHELQVLAKELGIAGHVCFAPPQYGAAKRITYAAVHGVVLPSLSEGFPIAILEAWSAGLPVLMTPECNLPEGFEMGAAQRIAADPASIADGLADFFALNDEERREMGKRGRQLVEDRFVWNRIADDTGAVYRWLIDGGAPPPCVVFD